MDNESLLGKAIGTCFASSLGLKSILLPEGLPREVADSVVNSINAQSTPADGSKHSLRLIGTDLSLVNPKNFLLGNNAGLDQVMENRYDNRVVVSDSSSALVIETLTTAFAPVIRLDFPAGVEKVNNANGQFSLQNLSQAIVQDLRAEVLVGADISQEIYRNIEASVLECLGFLREVYESCGEFGTWNVNWFLHVDAGLRVLHSALISSNTVDFAGGFNPVFASMGLPQPANLASYAKRNDAARYVEIVVDRWTSEEEVSAEIHRMEMLGAAPTLNSINWSGLSEYVPGRGPNPVLKLVSQDNRNQRYIEAWASVGEDHFFTVASADASKLQIFSISADGELSPTQGQLLSSDVAVISVSPAEDGVLKSDMLCVVVPINMHGHSTSDLNSISARSDCSIGISGNVGNEFQRSQILVTENGIEIHGYVLLKSISGKAKLGRKGLKLALVIEPADSLRPFLEKDASARAFLVTEGCGNLITESFRGGKSKPPELLPPHTFKILSDGSIAPSDDVEDYEVAVVDGQSARFYCLDGEVLGVGTAVSGVDIGNARVVDSAFDGGEVHSGRFTYKIQWESTDSDSVQSPLIAALLGTQPSLNPLPPLAANSLRGVVEEEYRLRFSGSDSATAEVFESLGHVFLPSESRVQVNGLVPSPTRHFLIPPELDFPWSGPGAPIIPSELLAAAQLEQFRLSIQELQIESILRFETGRNEEAVIVCPSQARLTDREFHPDLHERIENYLLAYEQLLKFAKSIASDQPFGQLGVFWASYPFSVSVWAKSPFPKCDVVMLSPLHPLRISWLMGVEQAFRDSTEDLRRSLAGVVEGWNLPLLGPSNDLGRMMAVPTDNGPGQVFLGWNMMTRVAVGGPPGNAVAHEFAGNLRIPGSSSSGISRRGVTRAIKDYRSVYPHVSTLTIDLASSEVSPRMQELDAAVIAEASDRGYKSGSHSLPGGVRVIDSLNRTGPIPDVKVLQTADGEGNLRPLVWKRYDPNSSVAASGEVDVRILQDPGAITWLDKVNDDLTVTPVGVLGPVPFRRLEVRGKDHEGPGNSSFVPSIGPESRSVFSKALSALEKSLDGSHYRVSSFIPPGYFGDSAPNWTVSGETSFRPGAMPELLRDDAEFRVLWEWSPSFLEPTASGVPELDSRPYISITRVSSALRDQLKSRLSLIEDFPLQNPDLAAHRILRTLGIRGVGLSRLAAGKDERTVGAIGFALSLELAGRNASGIPDAAGVVDHWDFVFPIDVCIQYLRGMGGKDLADLPRRADLLIFRIYRDGRMRIAPIEIKVRKLNVVVSAFPSADDADLGDAREQLVQTMKLLDSIRDRFKELDVSSAQGLADRYLMSTALAALVDAAIGLSVDPIRDRGGLRSALNEVASGDGSLDLARPIIIYIGNGNKAGLNPFVERLDLALGSRITGLRSDTYAQFLLNAGRLGMELWGDSSSPTVIQEGWRRVVDWSFAMEGSEEPERQELTPPTGREVSSDIQDLDGESSEKESTIAETPQPVFTDEEPPPGNGDSPDARASAKKESIDGDSEIVQSDGIRFPVGTLSGVSGESWVDFWPSNTELSQMNIGVVGTLGTGKTELVKSLVYRIRQQSRNMNQPVSFLILDYKGDYKGEEFLESIDGYAVGHEPIPLNLFELAGEYSQRAAWRKARQFVDVIKRIYGGVGAVQSERLEKSITDLFEEAGGLEPTINEVAERYRSEAGGADSVTGILSVFTRGGWFSSDRSKIRKFSEMLGDRVLVVSLEDPEMDDSSKTAVAALFLNLYRQHMLDQTIWPFQGQEPQLRRLNSYVLVDEAHNVMNLNLAALREILLQGRQFGVGVILSSQFLSHFKNTDEDYREPLLTWFIHKIPALRPQELRDLGIATANDALVTEILGLPVSSSLYKSLGVDGRVIREVPYWRIMEETRNKAD